MDRIFSVRKQSEHGRLGNIFFNGYNIKTPNLYPVVSMVTGTTPRGGGIWKYILQADPHGNGLLRRNLPVMSQVLSFLDFQNLAPKAVNIWREKGIRNFYNELIEPPLNYSAPIFLDSGGYKLLWNDNLDLSRYDLSIKDGKGPETILNLQKSFGAEIIASLDYPLPPGLPEDEALVRIKGSLSNAIKAIELLKNDGSYRPLLYLAVHGQNAQGINKYVNDLFIALDELKYLDFPIGLAIGSLVPLRGANKITTIIDLIIGARNGIPEPYKNTIPIHVFGITGNLIPILTFLGIDSFDSSTYVQQARSLNYYNPKKLRFMPILELENWTCNCKICSNTNLREIQDALTSEITNRPQPPHGYFKSKYYSDIALHNLEMDFKVVEGATNAIDQNLIVEFLNDFAKQHREIQPAMEKLSDYYPEIRLANLPHSKKSQPLDNSIQTIKHISLKFTSDSFNILSNGYQPPIEKDILLIIPCSGEKPYSKSRSHRTISELLNNRFGERINSIHKVTLSGLYGPVPEEFEEYTQVKNYDFRLETFNTQQIDLIASRTSDFLCRFGPQYRAVIAYATSRPYRLALAKAQKGYGSMRLLPNRLSAWTFSMFYKKSSLDELVNCLEEVFKYVSDEKG